jgi:hypothetical protein
MKPLLVFCYHLKPRNVPATLMIFLLANSGDNQVPTIDGSVGHTAMLTPCDTPADGQSVDHWPSGDVRAECYRQPLLVMSDDV